MKGKYWVMILAIVLVVVLIVALAACGSLRDGTEVEDDDGALAAILANLNKKTAEKVEVEDEKPANNGGGHTGGGGGNGGNTGNTGDNGNTENTGDNGESGTGESGNEGSSTLGQGITDIVIGSNSLFGEGRIARGIGEIIDAIFGG